MLKIMEMEHTIVLTLQNKLEIQLLMLMLTQKRTEVDQLKMLLSTLKLNLENQIYQTLTWMLM